MLCDFVLDHNHWRLTAKALDVLQPILCVNVLATLTTVENQQVETPLGQEELMGGMHDLLAAEVPNVKTERVGSVREEPVRDPDALGLELAIIELVFDEAFDKRCLADFSSS